ncbi:rRNA pseudouridine synthase [Candidatus Falkowbacteria bacterium]|uniref:Pseudouridine synthase n=1 Tax=Candidatus Buchananbacteria bacterium CG10_big_fil_rev_8_21_14_0_10_33_19 TaxID=1974525 RepID=A0A2H0W3K4_9BACT|nr:rRNA pseudouridine synthase [Candidatus Falkowbacteria bacterium]PIS05953.1 MAG: rRNA pseudouridine synthase [Candidatus Buchananbacteria bacterium CG10_big_fil_rev_8_21_14_0_10_33_19]
MIRLQKFLADAGVASRRKAEELILAGRIKVNGQVVKELGTKVDEVEDKIEYNGNIVSVTVDKVYIALNKPIGYISSATSSQGKSVLDLVDVGYRIYPVGRLDKDSSGLILLTNDGDFTNKLTHAKYGCEKEYEVVIDKSFLDIDKKAFESGMKLAGYKLQPVQITLIKDNLVRLVLKEGINRQIRKMMGKRGYSVISLKRIRIGKLKLANLELGKWKKINNQDV